MSRLLLIFLMLGPACLVTAASKHKRTEEVLAPAGIAVILVLYLFYVFDQLLIGFYVAVGLLLGCWAAGVFLHLRRPSRDKLARFLSPGLAVFLLALVVIWMVTKRSQTRHFDELRLWAGVPRALFQTDRLQLGPDCFTYPTMQSYYPGIALFQYFFQKLGSAFSENGLFFAYSFLGLTLIIPCCRALPWRNGLWVFPLSLVMVLLPLTFANGLGDFNVYYYSIYIDPLLGLAFAYSLFSLWQLTIRQERLEQTAYILSLCLLILLKDSGLLLAILSMGICCFTLRTGFRKKALYLLIAAGAVAATAGIWKILLARYDVHNHIGFGDAPMRLLGGLTSHQTETLRSFFQYHLVKEELTYTRFPGIWSELPIHRSWLFFTLFFALWSLLLWLAHRQTDSKTGGLMIGLHISNLVYQISLLVLYLCAMGSVLCYPRYGGTMTLAMMALHAMVTLDLFISRPVSQRILSGFGVIGLVIVLSFTFELRSVGYIGVSDPVDSGIHHVSQIVMQMPEHDETVDLFVVQDQEPGKNHHQILFRLIEENIRSKSYYMDAMPEEDYTNARDWLAVLLENQYDYVYLESFTPAFADMMGELFESGQPEACRLYAVTPDGLTVADPEHVPALYVEPDLP